MKHLLLGTTAALLLAPALSMAQTQTPNAARPQVAQRCMQDLQAFGVQMREDGMWLSGYRTGYGWARTGAPLASPSANRTAADTPVGTGPVGARGGSADRARAADVQAQGGGAIGAPMVGARTPWANTGWTRPPMQEIRTLHAGAIAMAQRGEERGCQLILAEAREAYDSYGARLREAGVDPDNIVTYRQQQLVAATPVTEMNRAFRADNITGTDVRNPRDAWLGSVEDVIVDPNTGRIGYLILGRGGFLGIGEDYVAVPWDRMRATPNMDVFVLDVTEAALDQAPQVEPEAMANAEAYGQRRQQIDRFWQQQDRG
ncbi:PRC-barrel domain containing protein [Roseomonas frigidaquae]|uniref:PRC-barrel domain containing protein n=1 Tax=Falsiroseomonas frigidaquae TaxID=487318 RepID=A0ABX1F7W2_9PROT|nr:PRC-barrel domain-containing protein [Falsiroseomonas frigidaquae]NKE48314.1 PRC-barrel domain containing protein [Falsiroseomonas frigidaquae]